MGTEGGRVIRQSRLAKVGLLKDTIDLTTAGGMRSVDEDFAGITLRTRTSLTHTGEGKCKTIQVGPFQL